jgi:hypothetical protein
MKFIIFFFHYIRLLFEVAFGIHKTLHPLGIKWRWDHWRLNGRDD